MSSARTKLLTIDEERLVGIADYFESLAHSRTVKSTDFTSCISHACKPEFGLDVPFLLGEVGGSKNYEQSEEMVYSWMSGADHSLDMPKSQKTRKASLVILAKAIRPG